MATRWRRYVIRAVLLIAAASAASASTDPAAQMALGNPSNAKADGNPRNHLISRPQYALAYIRDYGAARWVSWHLSSWDIGTAERSPFRTDASLPPGWYRVRPDETPPWSSEKGGLDRGHLCPSADRSASEGDNRAVFLMTNIVPQDPGNNRGAWKALEEYERRLVRAGNECYIISGIRGVARRVSRGRVAVPAYIWKVIVSLPERDGDDLARMKDAVVVAVEMPNAPCPSGWESYSIRVAELERRTALRFFTALAPDVRDEFFRKEARSQRNSEQGKEEHG